MKRNIKRSILLIVVFSVIGGLVYGGIWFYNLVSIQYPDSMIQVDTSEKTFGKLTTFKDKTANYFIVLHSPTTGVEILDSWIDTTTTELLNQIKKDVLIPAILQEGDDPLTLFQDYQSNRDGDIVSINLVTYLNGERINQRAKTYNLKDSRFLTVEDFFEEAALKHLTNEAREAIDAGELSRSDFLTQVNLLQPLDNLYIKGSTFTFNFGEGLTYSRDISSNPEYLSVKVNGIEPNADSIPPTYVKAGVNPEDRLVALTFDDGPSPRYTTLVLDLLDKYNASATFFLLGVQLDGNESIVVDILNRGHQIGNHSWNHPNLTSISVEDAKTQVSKTEQAIQDITGYTEQLYVRPPYGSMTVSLRETLNMVFVNWSVDSEDWLSKDPDTICKRITHDAYDGSIILMHDIYKTSYEALDCVMSSLTEEGYTFVTVQELLEARGNPTNGQIYRYARKK